MTDGELIKTQNRVCKVYDHGDYIIKTFEPQRRDRWGKEIYAYTHFSFATPELLDAGDGWLKLEKLQVFNTVTREQAHQAKAGLLDRLDRVESLGWWHSDLIIKNIVWCPSRGALVIDWEKMKPAKPGKPNPDKVKIETQFSSVWSGSGRQPTRRRG